ncbi:MAG: GGDEF domain-containing protein [Clostridiales bacterium]|nr:GGDEF domain-containing protein [Clostridiales bacterium]
MNESRMLEMLIAVRDHRVLSANAEAWLMVQDNVFSSLEQFLTEDSRDEFLRRAEGGEDEWFLLRFSHQPDTPYLAKLKPSAGTGGDQEPALQLMLARPQEVMPDLVRAVQRNDALTAMLSLTEDLYFSYRTANDTITLYNAARSRYPEGTQPLGDFIRLAEEKCDENSRPAWRGVLSSLRDGTPRFQVSVPCNLYNDDPAVACTMIKGAAVFRENRQCGAVGLIHPQRARSAGETDAGYDPLTGVMNKTRITRLATDRVDQLHAEGTTLAILDVDYFKHVNDNYGHAFGDQVLRRVAAIMEAEVGGRGAVGRIGGDEFFIVFYHIDEPGLRACLRSIKSCVNAAFPGKGPRPGASVSVTIGAAAYPKDADNYEDLFMVADYCLYLGKQKGRNRYIHYTPLKHPPLEEIRKIMTAGEKALVNGRDDTALGDVLAQMQYLVRYGNRPRLSSLIAEFADRFQIPLMTLYDRESRRVAAAAGAQRGDEDAARMREDFSVLAELDLPQFQRDGMLVINNVDKLARNLSGIRETLLGMDLRSVILLPFADCRGRGAVLALASLHRNVFWNESHYAYYRLFSDELARYDLAAEAETQ